MPDEITVQVVWGPRAETAGGVAARWRDTRLALAELSPLLAGWYVHDGESDVRIGDGTAEETLVADAARDDGYGYRLTAYAGAAAATPIHYTATAGLARPEAGLLNGVTVAIAPARTEDARSWDPLLAPMLAALAAVWQPDWGQAGTRRQRVPQRGGPRTPWAGRVTYLSPLRASVLPAGGPTDGGPVLPTGFAAGAPTADGGLVLTAASTPDAVALGALLRDAGAFAPVPEDRDRWSPPA